MRSWKCFTDNCNRATAARPTGNKYTDVWLMDIDTEGWDKQDKSEQEPTETTQILPAINTWRWRWWWWRWPRAKKDCQTTTRRKAMDKQWTKKRRERGEGEIRWQQHLWWWSATPTTMKVAPTKAGDDEHGRKWCTLSREMVVVWERERMMT